MDPEQKIKALQQKLQAEGLYNGPIDGIMGKKTQAAAEQFRAVQEQRRTQKLRRLELETRQKEAQAKQQAAEVEGREADATAKRRAEMEEWENSPEGMTYNLGLTYGAPVGGAVGGHMAGHGTSKLIDAMSAGRANSLDEIVSPMRNTDLSRVPNDPALRARAEGTVNAAQRYLPKQGMRGALEKGLGTAARGASYFGPAALLASEGYLLRQNANPSDDEFFRPYEDMQRAGGTAMMGAGAGLAYEGARRMFYPPADPQGYAGNVARVEQLRSALQPQSAIPTARQVSPAVQAAVRQPQQLQPAQTQRPALPPAQTQAQGAQRQSEPIRHSQRLGQAVSAAGGKPGKSKQASYNALRRSLTADNAKAVAEALDLPSDANRTTILQRARELLNTKGVSSIMGPLIAAGVAYDAATSDAQAADGEVTTTDRAKGAAAGAAAGGATYGIQKGMEGLARVAPNLVRSLGAGGMMNVPQAIADATDVPPDELAAARNWMARNMPEFMQFGKVGEAAEMAQVPERNPERAEPQENPYPPKLLNRIKRMKKQGASDDQIANFLNRAMP